MKEQMVINLALYMNNNAKQTQCLGISDKSVTKLACNPDGVFLWHDPLNRWPALAAVILGIECLEIKAQVYFLNNQ